MSKVIQRGELSFKKESSTKKTNKDFKSEVNSDLKSEYNKLKYYDLNHYNYNYISNYIKHSIHLRKLGISASVVLTAIMTLAVIPIVNRAYTTEAASGTRSETTMTISDGKATVNLTTTSTEGTFATSSSTEMAEFGVKTTNYCQAPVIIIT